jgi:hypothetical protein
MERMKSPSAPQVSPGTASPPTTASGTEAERISVYHWLVVALAASGWLFD